MDYDGLSPRQKHDFLSNRISRLRAEIGEIESEMKSFGQQDPHRGHPEWRRLNDRRANLQLEVRQIEPDLMVISKGIGAKR